MTGRPRSFDRDRALDVARDAFWRTGYDAVSIAELTHAMGINPPSLYAAFGDKHRLFGEACKLYATSYWSAVQECFAAPTARAAVAELLCRAAEAHVDPATPPGCLLLSEPRLAPERAALHEAIAERIRRGQRDGDTAPELDADALAGFLEAVLRGMSARARDGAGREELLATARFAVAPLA